MEFPRCLLGLRIEDGRLEKLYTLALKLLPCDVKNARKCSAETKILVYVERSNKILMMGLLFRS